jgi:ABC-type Fe3+ transport system substrate-binding protein
MLDESSANQSIGEDKMAQRDSKTGFSFFIQLAVILEMLMTPSIAVAASANPALLTAKQEAEARAYIFAANREEIVANAKKEGKVRVFGSLDAQGLKALSQAFRKKYPFVDAQVEEITGMENYTRMLMEMKAGLAKSWDVNYVAFDLYPEYVPHQKKFDILGMAQHGVVQIPVKMIDPINRHIVAVASDFQVIAYNKKYLPPERLPNTWEDLLKEEFKGRKFVLDIRPKDIAALVPAWGLEKTVAFARKLAAQEPVWVRGGVSRILMQTGEHHLVVGANLATPLRAQDKDPNIAYKILEPVPARLNEAEAILNAASNPYAGLLWLEFVCSPEGQKILDQHEPYGASFLTPHSVQEKLTRGLKLSIVDWDHLTKMEDYQKKIVEAYGFPRAQK